jgi:hypothetical protein
MSNRLFLTINPENRIRKKYAIDIAMACRLHAPFFFFSSFQFLFLLFNSFRYLFHLLIVPVLLFTG